MPHKPRLMYTPYPLSKESEDNESIRESKNIKENENIREGKGIRESKNIKKSKNNKKVKNVKNVKKAKSINNSNKTKNLNKNKIKGIKDKIVCCPHCLREKNVIKKGKRKNQLQTIQLYFCKVCKKYFFPSIIKHTKYPIQIILRTLLYYNTGHTQKETSKYLAKRFHIKVKERTISSWIKKYRETCTFQRIRKKAISLSLKKFYMELKDSILSYKLYHQQFYVYKLHKTKLELQKYELSEKKYSLLKDYLYKITTYRFPHHIFKSKKQTKSILSRSSQIKFSTFNFIRKTKHNKANQLTALALALAKNNKQRHEVVQNFMLVNDSTTIACEIPVYLTQDDILYFKKKGFTLDFYKEIKTPITGHIDLLQIRNGLIHILDYKPKAKKVKAIHQLTIYALALASRTKLAVKDFKCAWFDENDYYEFFPLHAVYKK